MPPTRPRRRPSTAPGARTSAETREIIRLTQSRKEIYPDLKRDKFDEKNYLYFVNELKKKPNALPKIQKGFLKKILDLEKLLKTVSVKEFSYDKAKASAKTAADKAKFNALERQITITRTANQPLGLPNLEKLFAATTQAEFDANMRNTNIIKAPYANNAQFKRDAQNVFNHIQTYRRKHSKTIQQGTIDAYLNDIFAAKEDEIEKRIRDSKHIRGSLLSAAQRAQIIKGWYEFNAYKKRLKNQLDLEHIVNKDKETFLTKPVEYAKSGERYIATKIQKMRENWAGMDGKERVIAGLTILVGTAWFLNSNNEGATKARDMMKKVGLMALGYIGLNTTSKVLMGRSLSSLAGTYIEDRSGKRDFLKKSFNTDKEGAETMNTSLTMLGNYDFQQLAKLYTQQRAFYDKYPTPDKLKELKVGGVAESEMTPNKIYKAVRLLDIKLHKQNSSIAQILEGIKRAKREARIRGKKFISPTYAMIVTAVLKNQPMAFTIKGGKIETTYVRKVETTWNLSQKDRTKLWWPVTGRPQDWIKQAADPNYYPKSKVQDGYLKRISENFISRNKPLSSFITKKNFNRYHRQFSNLYEYVYKQKPSAKFHMYQDTAENAMYMTSKVNVDEKTFTSPNSARVAAVQNAYQQAINRLKLQYKNDPKLKHLLPRIHEFAQPIHGVFMAPTEKHRLLPGRQPTKKPKQYVLFIRMVLPGPTGSTEFTLRKNKEWTEGDMIQQMKEKPLRPGEVLTRSDFGVIAKERQMKMVMVKGIPRPKAFGSAFGGAYESFLARIRLKKSETDQIDKALKHYSNKFANSGLSKAGLIRYLATHRFTEKEIRAALGIPTNKKVPNQGLNVEFLIRKTTETVVNAGSGTPDQKAAMKAQIMAGLGNTLALACHGDIKAKIAISKIDMKLFHGVNVLYPLSVPGVPQAAPSLLNFTKFVINPYQKLLVKAALDKKLQKKIKSGVDSYLDAY